MQSEEEGDGFDCCVDGGEMSKQPEALRLASELEAPVGTQSTYSVMQQAAAELRRLHGECDALRADAERYRWLRDMDEDPVMSLAAQYTDCNGSAISISMRVDASIDAERAALKEAK